MNLNSMTLKIFELKYNYLTVQVFFSLQNHPPPPFHSAERLVNLVEEESALLVYLYYKFMASCTLVQYIVQYS